MAKHLLLAPLLIGLVSAQTYTVQEHLDTPHKAKCKGELPRGFACAVLFDISPHVLDGIGIASVVGGESDSPMPPPRLVREVSLILDGTLYTAVYDPPLKRDGRFSGLGRNAGIPAQVDGDELYVQWPDDTKPKAKVIRRERINPHRPEPA